MAKCCIGPSKDYYLRLCVSYSMVATAMLVNAAQAHSSAHRRVPISTTTHTSLGFSIDVPPQSVPVSCADNCVRFDAAVSPSSQHVDVSITVKKIGGGIDAAMARTLINEGLHGHITSTESTRGGHLLFVLEDKASVTEYWYFIPLEQHTLLAVCRGAQVYATDLERICRSLRPFASRRASSKPSP